jgi:hypothetical protein
MVSTDVREPRGPSAAVHVLGIRKRERSVERQDVEGPEDPTRPGRGGDITHGERPSGSQHAECLGQRSGNVAEVMERKEGHDPVEPTVLERKSLRHALHEIHGGAEGATARDLPRVRLKDDDLAGPLGEALGGHPGPPTEVEDSNAGSGSNVLPQSTE